MPRKRETGGVRKRGRVWWIYYRVDGQRYDESTKQGDEREARRLLAQRRREIREGTWKPAAERRALTVSAYAVQWLARRRQAGVRFVRDEETRLRSWVLPLLGDKSLSAVTRVDVREVMANAQQTPNPKTGRPYAPRTVLHIYGAMRLMFGRRGRRRAHSLDTMHLEDPTGRAAHKARRRPAVALAIDLYPCRGRDTNQR